MAEMPEFVIFLFFFFQTKFIDLLTSKLMGKQQFYSRLSLSELDSDKIEI